MDKYLKYQAIIQDFIKDLASFGQYPSENVETQIIADNANGHYLLYYNGWEGKRRTYGCLLHLELKPQAKVYMHYNGTNLQITDELIEKGIEKQDIVLAFQPPYVRAVSGYGMG
jgi:hypothetical protein